VYGLKKCTIGVNELLSFNYANIIFSKQYSDYVNFVSKYGILFEMGIVLRNNK